MALGLTVLSCALIAGACHPAAAPGTRSYVVRVSAPATAATVRLSALEVPRGWIAWFCTASVCSPYRVTLALRAGVGTAQLSYAPTGAGGPRLQRLHVVARGADGTADVRGPAAR